MPSFDIVSRVEMQEVDNAVNQVRKVIATRYDFRGSSTEMTLHKQEKRIRIVTEDEMKLKAVQEELVGGLVRRKVDPKVLAHGEIQATSKGMIKRDTRIREGIDMDTARKIVKMIKALKRKVQAQIQDQQVRVSGKKIDDLQAVIAMLREQDLEIPLQYVNQKS